MNYEDLAVTHIEQTCRWVDASGSQGLNRQMPEIDLQRSDTLGLHSDEMAELVGLQVNSYRSYVDDNDYSGAPLNHRSAMTIAVNYDDASWVRNNDIETDNIGASGELTGRTRLDDSSRILWNAVATYIQGSSSDDMLGAEEPVYVPFRARFGQGPLVDANDSLTHGAFIRTVGYTGAQSIVQLINWTGYWDIFEVERPVRRRS